MNSFYASKKVNTVQSGSNLKKSYLEEFQNVIAEQSKKDVKHTILIVDDEDNNLQLLKRTLRSEYIILMAKNGQEACEIVEQRGNEISLIISDQRMPVMKGTELFTRIVNKYPHTVNMLLTGQADMETLMESVNECNLFQYILKPFDPNELKLIVQNGIEVYELSSRQEELVKDLKELFYTTIKSIASALDAKDPYTHGHSQRVTLYSLILAKEMGVNDDQLEEIETAGLLHDIGKIGIPESILCKPGKLTDEEFEIMKSHPTQGQKMLNGIKQLKAVSDWMNSHHERWDGRGYPSGMQGEEIPLTARIIAIADTYDAMTSNRPYRDALAHDIALEEIQRCRDSQFDPRVVDAFVKVHNIFNDAKECIDEYYAKYSMLYQYFN